MKIFLLYAACALLSGGKSLVFALPMTYFCSRALAEMGNPPLTAESGEISGRERAARNLESAVRSVSLVSCGFLLSELLAAVSIAMRVRAVNDISLEGVMRTALFPVAMYLLTVAVTLAASAHLRRTADEKTAFFIRTLSPLAVIIVGGVFLRGM